MIIGDWNANLGTSGTSLFGPIMEEFCKENNLIISTKKLLPADSHSHISRRTDRIFKSWLDHVVSSNDCHAAIEKTFLRCQMKQMMYFPKLTGVM